MPGLKTILLPIALLVSGVGVGSGAAFATSMLLGAADHNDASTPEAEPTALVEVDNVVAPLVLPDGQRLAGYVAFDLALQVPEESAEDIAARLPLLRHEINMRTYRTPMASGPDGTLPTLEVFRGVVQEAANAAFGKGTVSDVAIASAMPA